MLDLDEKRAASTPRDAATVVIVRDRPLGRASRGSEDGPLEVFCVKRHKKSGFMGGVVVFPGGKLDEADLAEVWAKLATEPVARAVALAEDPRTARGFAVAAAREMLEEAGIVPTQPGVGAEVAEAMRAELATPIAPGDAAAPPGGALASVLEARGLRLDLSVLVPMSRWITPAAEQRRFDARFFLMALPPGQEGRHDELETTQSFWASPARLLEQFAAGEIMLAPPTLRLLELLASAPDASAAATLAAELCLDPICPEFAMVGDMPTLTLPGDPLHSVDSKRISGKTRFILQDGKFVSADP